MMKTAQKRHDWWKLLILFQLLPLLLIGMGVLTYVMSGTGYQIDIQTMYTSHAQKIAELKNTLQFAGGLWAMSLVFQPWLLWRYYTGVED